MEKKIYLVYPKKIGTIAAQIYGHFAEHIGGVYYDGLWVGKNSDIPNINGFRKYIVEKLREIKHHNKEKFAKLVMEKSGVALNTHSVFDVQIKRLHE